MIVDHVDTPESVNQPLNVYEEIFDQAVHVYLELNAGERNESVDREKDNTDAKVNATIMRKESLKLKSSYATPMDSVREKPDVERYDSNAIDPKYSFPYDSVERLNKGAINTIEELNTDRIELNSVINDSLVDENCGNEDVITSKKIDTHHAIVEKKTPTNDTIVEQKTDASDNLLENNIEKCNDDSCVEKATNTAGDIKEKKTDTNNIIVEKPTFIKYPIFSNNTGT